MGRCGIPSSALWLRPREWLSMVNSNRLIFVGLFSSYNQIKSNIALTIDMDIGLVPRFHRSNSGGVKRVGLHWMQVMWVEFGRPT